MEVILIHRPKLASSNKKCKEDNRLLTSVNSQVTKISLLETFNGNHSIHGSMEESG